MSGINSSVIIQNTEFSLNEISFQLINIENSKYVLFQNLICSYLNTDTKSRNQGGCFRTNNILNREIKNISIIESFSYSSNLGIKFIDNQNNINDLGNIYNVDSFAALVKKKNITI